MTRFDSQIIASFFLLATFGCTSQEPIQTKPFTTKNIPEHIFNMRSDKLKDTIVSLFSLKNQFENKSLGEIFYYHTQVDSTMFLTFEAETSKNTLFSRQYFSKPNTSHDIFLHDFHMAWVSKFYYSGNHPLEYVADFVVKLYKIDDSSTKVSIIAVSSEVINGTSGYGAHGAIARYTPVQPTTIEEYRLLEFIATKLGDTLLLPLRLPDK